MEILLTQLRIGTQAEIKRVLGNKKFKQEMERKGIKTGGVLMRIALLNNDPSLFPEKVVVEINRHKFVLDLDEARKIIVEKEKRVTGLKFNPA